MSHSMTGAIIVFVTTNTLEEAEKIGEELIINHLAACVNVVTGITSIYRWQGNVCKEREFLLLIKTLDHLFPEVKNLILRLHSYELPEIIALPISEGLEPYLRWLEDECKGN